VCERERERESAYSIIVVNVCCLDIYTSQNQMVSCERDKVVISNTFR